MTAGDLSEKLAELGAPFLSREEMLRDARACEPADLPDRPRRLLVHHEHMTATLSAWYGGPVELEVIRSESGPSSYARYIRLREPRNRRVVEVGLMRLNLAALPEPARNEVLAQRQPLGEILIRHDVLRRVETRGYFAFGSGSPVVTAFDQPGVDQAWGRVGFIYCNEQPGIELLEAVC